MTRTPDTEAVVTAFLAAALPDVRVRTDMPEDFTVATDDPCTLVWINALPGQTVQRAWSNHTMLWYVATDVDCFGPKRSDAVNLSREVEDALPTITTYVSSYGQIARVNLPTFGQRPDWNTRARRYGGVVEFWVRPAQATG
jgi:hypothetical protein